MSDHDTVSIQEHIRVYLTVFGALAVLTVTTVLASYLDISTSEAIFLALVIASVKGSLVAGYFMHLISEKKLIHAVLILTAAFFVALLLLPILTVSDSFGIDG